MATLASSTRPLRGYEAEHHLADLVHNPAALRARQGGIGDVQIPGRSWQYPHISSHSCTKIHKTGRTGQRRYQKRSNDAVASANGGYVNDACVSASDSPLLVAEGPGGGLLRVDGQMKRLVWILFIVLAILALAVGGLWYFGGWYVVHAFLLGRGGYWIDTRRDDPGLSPSVRRALLDAPPAAPGNLEWQMIRDGFEVGELAVITDGGEVDRLFLARIAPAKFRFEVRNEPAGDRNLDSWMTKLGAAAVINGSYFAPNGTPATPVLSAGRLLGPASYDAKAGAFVASAVFAGIRDLAKQSWQDAFDGARDAMVSYPLLVSEEGTSRVAASQWLASRSFIGQDIDGNIILGTTLDGFFSLDRLSSFLRQSPLRLKLALNLDGGPIACQGISLDGFERRACGKWEIRADDARVRKLVYNSPERPTLPIVLAAFPK
jgi:Phosphodiester glycosidase